MPFTTDDVAKHTKKATTAKLRRQWLSVANGQLSKCIADGGTDKSCAPRAISMANGVIKKRVEEMSQEANTDTAKADDAKLEEGWDQEEHSYSAATSFADLAAERETKGAIRDLRKGTTDLFMLVNNVMFDESISDKPGALQGLFTEFVAIVEDSLGNASASMEADLSESATAITLTEIDQANLEDLDDILENAGSLAELSNPRRFPVLVDFPSSSLDMAIRK